MKSEKRALIFNGILTAVLALLLCMLIGSGRKVLAAGSTGTVSVKLNKKSVTVWQGASFKLKLRGAVSGKVKWSSSDENIAAVSSKGKVTAAGGGTCRIRAKYKGKTYRCRVKVKKLKISPSSLTMIKGRSSSLTMNNAKIHPAWSSSDTSVVQVDASGTVKAVSAGKASVTASYRKVSCSIEVTVLPASYENMQSAYKASKANRGKILLAGSSSLDMWDGAAAAFSPYGIINTAIGGTTVVQWLGWYKTLITRYKPAAVVIYAGSNDLGNGGGITGEQNAANTIQLLKSIRSKLKKVPVFYVSIVPCYSRQGAWEKISVSNSLVSRYCASAKRMYYINLAGAMSLADGTPDRSLFLSDQLHPNETGYGYWKKYVAKKVKKVLKK